MSMTEIISKIPTPYPGLRPFDAADAAIFFGREAQVDAMLRKLEDHRFLAVVGTSGSGKSSLVRAGLIPAIREGFLNGVTDWVTPVIRPGYRPFERLADALLEQRDQRSDPINAGAGADSRLEHGLTVAALRRGNHGLAEAIEELGFPESTPVLLVVDQFEELFAFRRRGPGDPTSCTRDEAAAFVNLMLGTLEEARRPIWALLTMRSDFIGDCEAFLGLPEAVSNSQFLVPRLDRDQMEDAITGPGRLTDAAYAPFTFQPGVVNRLINDAGDRPDQLPLMQHALMRTWRMARDRVAAKNESTFCITLADYEAAGGIDSALSSHAERAWEEFRDRPEKRRLVRHLFLLLAEVSLDGQITRRRPPVAEVMRVSGASLAEVEEVVRVFQRDQRNFIVTSPPEGFTEETRLDISHEALLRQWGRLSGGDGWLAQEQAAVVELRRVVASANLHRLGQGDLLSALDLARINDWQDRVEPNSNWAQRYVSAEEWGAAKRFVVASRQAQQRAQQEAADRARTRRNIILGFSSAMTLIAVVAVALAVMAMRAKVAAAAAAKEARAAQVAAEEAAVGQRAQALAGESWHSLERDPVLSLLLAAASVKLPGTNKPVAFVAQRTLRDALARVSGDPIVARGPVQTSLDGRWAVNEGPAGPSLWDLAAPDPTDPSAVQRLDGLTPTAPNRVTALAVSEDRQIAATGHADGHARLWTRTTNGAFSTPIVLSGHSNWVSQLALSPDRRWLITVSESRVGDPKSVLLWDLLRTNSPAAPIPLRGHTSEVHTVIITPDSSWGITAGNDRTIRTWNLRAADPTQGARVLRGHNSDVYALAISADGNTLLSGSWDNTARLWDLSDPAANSVVLGGTNGHGHTEAVICVALSNDDKWAVTGSDDRTVRVWDRRSSQPGANPRVLQGHKARITTVAVSPTSDWLVTGSHDTTARLWRIGGDAERNPATNEVILRGHNQPVARVAVGPEAHWAIAASANSVIRWPLSDATGVFGAQPAILNQHSWRVRAVAVSPDGQWIASGSEDNTACLWSLGTNGAARRVVTLRGHSNHVSNLAFSPDSRWLLTGTEDRSAQLWSLVQISRGEIPQGIRLGGNAPLEPVTAVAISTNGWAAIGTSDGQIRLWNLATEDFGSNPAALAGHTREVLSLAFSPDGKWLLSGSGDATARLWKLGSAPSPEAIVLRGHTARIQAVAFSPDNHWAILGGADNSASLWDLRQPLTDANRIVLEGHSGAINALAVDPRSRWVITASDDNTARQWRLGKQKRKDDSRKFEEHQGPVVALAVSPDGRWLVSGSADERVILWDLSRTDPEYRPLVLAARSGPIRALAVTPDSRWAISGHDGGLVALWSISTPDLLHLAERFGGRNLTFEEWARALGTNEPYFKVFETLPIPPK